MIEPEGRPVYGLDFDSSLVEVETLDELADLALADHPERKERLAEVKTITNAGMEKRISFDESLCRRLQLFCATKDHVEETTRLAAESISPSALEKADWFARESSRLIVISGGFKQIIDPVVELLGIPSENVFANSFMFDEDGKITGVDRKLPLAQDRGKIKQVGMLALTSRFVMVGDGATDLEVRQDGLAEEFWVVTESVRREPVIAQADLVLSDFHAFVEATQEFDARSSARV